MLNVNVVVPARPRGCGPVGVSPAVMNAFRLTRSRYARHGIVAAPASEPLKIMPAFGSVAPVPLVTEWGSVSVRIHFTWVPTGTMVWLLLLLAGSWNAQQRALTMCGLCAAAGRMHAARTRQT